MAEDERTPLLRQQQDSGETFDNVPKSKRRLGLYSVIFLIFNRIIGTGIYATPSTILRTSGGSVGLTFVMWIVGALFACAGAAVYCELGTGLPRNGGEKNYLEYIYKRPRFIATCIFAAYSLVLGSGAPNSVVFAEYVINALGWQPTRTLIRGIAILCMTFGLILHGAFLPTGLRVQNTLGFFKLGIITSIGLCGILSLANVPAFRIRPEYEKPTSFDSWDAFWEGSAAGGHGVNAFAMGMYNIIWSFIGYSNGNYALSETRNPVRTIKRATSIAMITVTVFYLFVNIAYFGVVSKNDILESRRIIAALFFRNLFGPATEKILSIFVALSTLGNNLSVQFTQGRVIQELGREGVLPYSTFFSSNKPFDAPLAGIFTIYVVSCLFIVLPPPGDAYLFLLSLSSYSGAMVNTLVSLGLLLLYIGKRDWNPPFRAPKAIIVLFFVSNVFLVTMPLIPPSAATRTYERLPYWSHVVASISVSFIGIAYWVIWAKWLPQQKGYRLERKSVVDEQDGIERWIFERGPL